MLVSMKIESAAIVTIKILTAQREVAGPRPNIVRRQIQRLTRCSSRGVVFNDNHRGMFTGGNVLRQSDHCGSVGLDGDGCLDGFHFQSILTGSLRNAWVRGPRAWLFLRPGIVI